ncbi:hypothetical protein LLG95_05475 [bacterium]|nr:hypothetical protein [bacterium]
MLITKELIKAMIPFAPKKDLRRAIKTVRLERSAGQARAVATDGKIMMITEWKEPSPDDVPQVVSEIEGERHDMEMSIDAQDWSALATMVPKMRTLPALEVVAIAERINDHRLEVGSTDFDNEQRRQVRPVEMSYPDYRSVLPQYQIEGEDANAVALLVNAEKLAVLLKGFQDSGCVGRTHGEVLMVVPIHAQKPILFRGWNLEKSIDATAIITPVLDCATKRSWMFSNRAFDPEPSDDTPEQEDVPAPDEQAGEETSEPPLAATA